MRLTIIAPENVHEVEVDSAMEVQDVLGLAEAETGLPASSFVLSNDSGIPLTTPSKTLASYGMTGDSATIFLTPSNELASGSSSSGSASGHFPGDDSDIERMRLQALGNPELMAQLRNLDPEMARAVRTGPREFYRAFQNQGNRARLASQEKERQIEALNADPYDIEAQKKIEEAIRMEQVLANMEHAMEYSPESFGNVTMLYINVEVNGHPVKAFVDSGAQTTIISPECAEACGIMRLLDKRFNGVAEGVGTAKILGRIHSAQIKLGNLFLPCSFSVLEGRAVDLLFGLDMLKRHQCCIDLSTNTLRIQDTEIPFLPEHELPEKARRRDAADIAQEMGDAASQGVHAGVASPTREKATPFPGVGNTVGKSSASGSGSGTTATRTTTASSQGGSKRDTDIQTLIGLGAPRDQAAQLLDAAGGDVDVAASMLFG